MRRLRAALLTASAGAALVAFAAPASAEIVCNRWNECWHVSHHYVYPNDVGVVVHEDAWRDAHMHDYHWMKDRDDDRGYFGENGVWIALPPDHD